MSLEDVYQELILDHYKNPRHSGVLINPDRKIDLMNPLCGDQLSLTVKFKGEIISEIAFSGQGCSISQAAASIMAELMLGKTREEALQLSQSFRKMIKSEVPSDGLDELGDALALEGVKKHTARIKCALLAWDCIERAVKPEAEPQGSMREEIQKA
jgi:nitrogen fixation NifU-like protein